MIALNELSLEDIKVKLAPYRSIGIVSCGGCPAWQKKGGTVGIDRWNDYLKNDFEIKWSFVGPILCNESGFEIHIDELGERLEEVDAVLLFSCFLGEKTADELLGFPLINCNESLYIGIRRNNGTIEQISTFVDNK